MKEGLLWFDNDPKRKLADKVSQAAQRYQAKLQRKPTVCYLNVGEFDGQVDEVNGVNLRPVNYVTPHHFWIGVEQESKAA